MSDSATQSVPISTGVAVTASEDGNYICMTFKTRGEHVNIGIPAENLGHVIAHLIEVAESEAGRRSTKVPKGEITSIPIAVAGLGVAQGRSETEALLTIHTGPMKLTFAVDLPTLLGMCGNLQPMNVGIHYFPYFGWIQNDFSLV